MESASRRQKWIDQAQSLNLYIDNASGKKLDVTYRMAWFSGLKTTYYLRSLAATGTEKSTISTGTLNAVSNSGGEAPQPTAAYPAPVRWMTRIARRASDTDTRGGKPRAAKGRGITIRSARGRSNIC